MVLRLDDVYRDHVAREFRILSRVFKYIIRELVSTNEIGARSSQCLHGTSPRFPIPNNQSDALVERGDQHTAAVSTPVGPPPQTTKLRSLRRSSSVAIGDDAASKLSGTFKFQSAHGPQFHRLMNKLTYNPAANVLCVFDRLELEAVFETRDAVLRRDGATRDDEFVVPAMQTGC